MGNPFIRLWNVYNRCLTKYPLRTQMVQTGALMGAGDLISQKLILRKEETNYIATGRFIFVGSVAIAPLIRVWYLALERIVGTSISTKATLAKVALDQLGFAPLANAYILAIIFALQLKSPSEIKKDLEEKYMDVLISGWKVWPGVQLLNFYFVPFLVRPLVVSVFALFWNAYLAWKSN